MRLADTLYIRYEFCVGNPYYSPPRNLGAVGFSECGESRKGFDATHHCNLHAWEARALRSPLSCSVRRIIISEASVICITTITAFRLQLPFRLNLGPSLSMEINIWILQHPQPTKMSGQTQGVAYFLQHITYVDRTVNIILIGSRDPSRTQETKFKARRFILLVTVTPLRANE